MGCGISKVRLSDDPKCSGGIVTYARGYYTWTVFYRIRTSRPFDFDEEMQVDKFTKNNDAVLNEGLRRHERHSKRYVTEEGEGVPTPAYVWCSWYDEDDRVHTTEAVVSYGFTMDVTPENIFDASRSWWWSRAFAYYLKSEREAVVEFVTMDPKEVPWCIESISRINGTPNCPDAMFATFARNAVYPILPWDKNKGVNVKKSLHHPDAPNIMHWCGFHVAEEPV